MLHESCSICLYLNQSFVFLHHHISLTLLGMQGRTHRPSGGFSLSLISFIQISKIPEFSQAAIIDQTFLKIQETSRFVKAVLYDSKLEPEIRIQPRRVVFSPIPRVRVNGWKQIWPSCLDFLSLSIGPSPLADIPGVGYSLVTKIKATINMNTFATNVYLESKAFC